MTLESRSLLDMQSILAHKWADFKTSSELSSCPTLCCMARQPNPRGQSWMDRNLRRNVQYLLDGLYPDRKNQAGRFKRDRNFPRSTMQRILTGTIDAKLSQVIALAEALGRDPFELLASDISRPQERKVAAGSARHRVGLFSEGQDNVRHRPDNQASKPRRS